MKTVFLEILIICSLVLFAVACKKSDNAAASTNLSNCKITGLINPQAPSPITNTFIFNSNGDIITNNQSGVSYTYSTNKISIKAFDNNEQHDYFMGTNGFAYMQASKSDCQFNTCQNYDTTSYSYTTDGYLLAATTKHYMSNTYPKDSIVYGWSDTAYYTYSNGNLIAVLKGYKRDTISVYSYYTTLNNGFLQGTVGTYPIQMMGAKSLLGKPNKNLVKTFGSGGNNKPNSYSYIFNAAGQVTLWQIFPADDDQVFLTVVYDCN